MSDAELLDVLQTIRPISGHPVPFEQEKIDEIWDSTVELDKSDAPSVDEAHEDYIETIAEWGGWRVFRPHFPFGESNVTFWSTATGEAFKIPDNEGSWHELVNLFAEIVDSEGDCRDAEYSSSLTQSGSYKQRCRKCSDSWVIG